MKNLLVLILALFCMNAYPQNNPVGLKFLGDALVGDNPHSFYQGPPVVYKDINYPYTYNDRAINITINEVSPNYSKTYYDLQSNAVIKYIWQEQNNPAKIHAVFMVDTVGSSPSFPNRRSRYFVSNDTGNTWNYVAEVPNGIRSGFPCLISLSDDRQAILNHTTDGGVYSSQIYLNANSGSSIFSRLNPGVTVTSDPAIWPVGIPTNSVSSTNKIVFVASQLTSRQSYSNICTNLSGTGTFSGYIMQNNIEASQSYALARGPDNRIGIAYIANKTTNPSLTTGSVYFIESTDNGSTWSPPVPVWIASYVVTGIGSLRSIDVIYQGIYPKVIFNLCEQDGSGGYYPQWPSKIAFWSPNINNGNTIGIDTAAGLNGSNPTNDVFTSVSRAVIGTSSDGAILYAAYNKARQDTSSQGNNYFDVYFRYSTNGGLTWSSKTKITNNSGPLRDCRYVAISPTNNFTSSTNHLVHLIYQQDSIAGSFVNGSARSLARMMYAKIKITDVLTGTINSELQIPKNYTLGLNYPNPFNPVTRINYDIPKQGFVSLKVYDVIGREMRTLVNETKLPGNYSVDFNGSGLTSGVYFYKIQAGDFTETKRMMLIK